MPIELTEFERGAPFSGDAAEAITSLQDRIARLQLSQMVHRKRAIILFEGWTGSGKKDVLKQLVGALDPLHVRTIHVPGHSTDDDRHWLAPFWRDIPSAGDTTLFHRSWYRPVVEQRVADEMDDKRWARACDEINEFEAQQRDHGTTLIKLFFHVTAEKQANVLRARHEDPWLRHLRELEPVVSINLRERAIEVLHDFFAHTNTRWAPWTIIDANDDAAAAIAALTHVADQLEKAMPAQPPASDETIVPFRQARASERHS